MLSLCQNHSAHCALQQISKGDAELRQFEEAVVQHDAEIERVKEDAAGAEAEVARVEQELHQVGGPPIQEQRNQVEVLKKVQPEPLCVRFRFTSVHKCVVARV